MSKQLLITRPRYDFTTHYLFYWAEQVINEAQERGISILDLAQERANREEVVSMLRKRRPSLVFFNGHGNDGCVRGHNDDVLVAAENSGDLDSANLIYALSCRSANVLGRKAVQAGVTTYLGYDDDFIFMTEKNKVSRPLQDREAKLFLEPSNYLVTSLFKGHNTGDSYQRSQDFFGKNIRKVAASKDFGDYLIPFLFWDKKHQVCLGDSEARF